MSACMPCVVQQIGEELNMTPIAWHEGSDGLVIVFEQGPKLTFARKLEEEPKIEQKPEPQPKPVKTRKPRKAKK